MLYKKFKNTIIFLTSLALTFTATSSSQNHLFKNSLYSLYFKVVKSSFIYFSACIVVDLYSNPLGIINHLSYLGKDSVGL